LFCLPIIVKPTLWSVFCGSFPEKVSIHVHRFPIESLPITPSQINEWTLKLFREKDNLLESFHQNQYKFPTKQNEKLPHILSPPGLKVIQSAIFWIPTLLFLIYYCWPFTTVWWLLGIEIGSWTYFIIVSTSHKFRVALGLDPSDDFADKIQKS
jgi:hypothetical protein